MKKNIYDNLVLAEKYFTIIDFFCFKNSFLNVGRHVNTFNKSEKSVKTNNKNNIFSLRQKSNVITVTTIWFF